MNHVILEPTYLKGNLSVPPSKSMAHRAIICAALSKGESHIRGIDFSDDIRATIEGMKQLGAEIKEDNDVLHIRGIHKFEAQECVIDCKESGSTLRFLIPISLVYRGKRTFIGEGNLGKRPLYSYYQIFDKQGIHYCYEKTHMHLEVEGQLQPGDFYLEGDISSQFITGLLFALPGLAGDSTIHLTTPLESKGYIDLTLEMMATFGVEVTRPDALTFKIKGNQVYQATDYTVEGDYSQAAFYFVADALGSEVGVEGLSLRSKQGDAMALEFLQQMGCVLTQNENKTCITSKVLKGIEMRGKECPDIIPIMAVAAALGEGQTTILEAERCRIKECDRLHAIATELKKLGADIEERQDGLVIQGRAFLEGGCEVFSHHDHRIAMSLAIAATRCKESILLQSPECVAKSYPSFWEDYEKLGGSVKEVSEHEQQLGE